MFQRASRRKIRASFDGGNITSDGGALLLHEVEKRTGILEQFAHCFDDHRSSGRIEHSLEDLLAQLVYAIALGYEDLNVHDELCKDPMLAVLVGKRDPNGKSRTRSRDLGKPLAGKSTFNRLELSQPESAAGHRYKRIVMDEAFIDQVSLNVILQSHEQLPDEIILDLDATDDPLHGSQEGRFFHGYYGHYCYLPLYIFCGDHLLCARLRHSNIDGSAGSEFELDRIVSWIRQSWTKVRILVRGDSGFCREGLMAFCEERGVDYVFGLARNSRLEKRIAKSMRSG